MLKKSHDKVQWMFIGSRATDSEQTDETSKLRDKMARKERELHTSYLSLEERAMPILLDEKKCISMFSNMYGKYENLFFHKVLDIDKKTFKQKITKFFQSPSEASLIVYSGNAKPEDGTWHIESYKEAAESKMIEDKISFEDVMGAWKQRSQTQRHLLLIIDANYSGHWLRKLALHGDTTVTIQTSCRYWQKSVEDRNVGGYFLHNLCKIVKEIKNELIIEPVSRQTPGFYGNFHYVIRIFGLVLKFESWQDMRQALSEKAYGNWPRIKGWIRTPHSKLVYDLDYESYAQETYFYDKNGNRYEGNVDRNGNKEGFGVLYSKENILEYEGQFENDLKHGKGVLYDAEGYKCFEGKFIEGWPNGDGIGFDHEGFVNFLGTYEGSTQFRTGKEINKYGRTKFAGAYKENLKTGPGQEYYDNGALKTKGTWDHGKLTGLAQEYNESGVLLFEGEYENGNRTGRAKIYSADGILLFDGFIENGQYQGECRVYYPDGKLHVAGAYLDGQMHGHCIIYNRGGEINCEGEFVYGNLQGPGMAYYLNGNLMFNGEFEAGKAISVGVLRKENGSIHAEGKSENLIREVLTSSIYNERRKTKRFENKSVINNNLLKSEIAKTSFLLETTKELGDFRKTSEILSSSFFKRQSLDKVFQTQGSSIPDLKKNPIKKLNPLNPKGKNDQVAEKKLQGTRHNIDYKKKKIVENLEKKSLIVGKPIKVSSFQQSNNTSINLIKKNSRKTSELSQKNNSIDQTLKVSELIDLPKDAFKKESHKEALIQVIEADDNPKNDLKQKESTEKQNSVKQVNETDNFEMLHNKKYESEDEEIIRYEIYGNPQNNTDSDESVEEKRKKKESQIKETPKNPFTNQKSQDRKNRDKSDSESEFGDKVSTDEAGFDNLKKIPTTSKFEFVDSFRVVQNDLGIQANRSEKQFEFNENMVNQNAISKQPIESQNKLEVIIPPNETKKKPEYITRPVDEQKQPIEVTKSNKKVDPLMLLEEMGKKLDILQQDAKIESLYEGNIIATEEFFENEGRRISQIGTRSNNLEIVESKLVQQLTEKISERGTNFKGLGSVSSRSSGKNLNIAHKQKSIKAKLQITDEEGVQTFMMNL